MKKKYSTLIKIVIYIVVILLCMILYFKYGLIENEQADGSTYEPTVIPTSSLQPYPYRYEIVEKLVNEGILIDADVYYFNKGDSYYDYKFEYGVDSVYEGVVRMTVNKFDCIICCELQIKNFSNALGTIGEQDLLELESLKRDKENIELIRKFVLTCAKLLNKNDVIPVTILNKIVDKVQSAYLEDKELSFTEYGVHYRLICDESESYLNYYLLIK